MKSADASLLGKWLDAWGYADSPGSLHFRADDVPADHPYRSELRGLLDPEGGIQAKAVFDVDGVPTVCFLLGENSSPSQDALLKAVRERAWNQNLVSIVLVVDDQRAVAAPIALPDAQFYELTFKKARPFGEFSRADVQSGEVFSRHPMWFAPENRVDRQLLANLSLIVNALSGDGMSLDKVDAQLLMAQIMFVAYLEHRGIAGDSYRQQRNVGSLFDLVRNRQRSGVADLMAALKKDFNGDLLEPDGARAVWKKLPDRAFELLDDFLSYVDLSTGQKNFWRYDFRFIPVELISGIYESFLADEKRVVGAYYTPRHLATLAVDQAFAGSEDILNERIYDGACGSGILLTTAYRRMLAHGEAQSGTQWSFAKRIELLESSIFGSDINESACRVTAFSLYLSVLENLQPSDLVKLATAGKATLPSLSRNNICRGEQGDFFSDRNPLVKRGNFTLMLSNPPWVEPKGNTVLSSDTWAEENGHRIPRRQTSAAFMLRAMDAVDKERGRFCFILPVSVLGAATSQKFVADWLDLCELETVINFGDLRKLLFENAKQPTLVVVARPRRANKQSSSSEVFEYWTPKADVSLAFGRLTLHGTDRHLVQTSLLRQDNSVLTTLFWGTSQDQATIARLELGGQLGDLFKREGWRTGKGFHKIDRAVAQKDLMSTAVIADVKHLDARQFDLNGPLLNEAILLNRLPQDIVKVPNLNQEMLDLFRGPRIVFKDGMTPEREICAGFSSKRFSFTSSTGVIVAPKKDADVLRFLSVYLHSDMVRYLLLLTAYQISFERERVALHDIKRLPFVHPDDHDDPQRAHEIVCEIAGYVKEMEKHEDEFGRQERFEWWQKEAEKLLSEYFSLSKGQTARINELVEVVFPSVQPSSYANLFTPLQQRAGDGDLQRYVESLLSELTIWRDAMGGAGSFDASLSIGSAQAHGALAILRLDVRPQGSDAPTSSVRPQVADAAVVELINVMKSRELLPVQIQENLYLASDIVVRQGNSLYLIKPMLRRLWLQGEAFRDAERIVRLAQAAAA